MKFAGERRPNTLIVSGQACAGDLPRATTPERIGETMTCRQTGCQRRAHSRGWCTTHYRRWRGGHDMDAPIRGYVRYDEAGDGVVHAPARTIRRTGKHPFAKELALLKELGLR